MTKLRDLLAKATRPVAGFEGLYEVGADGRVWSYGHNWRGYGKRPLTAFPGNDGYLRVRLSDTSGRRLNGRVHQLVCSAFSGPRPSAAHEVRHLNGNSLDNRAENLTWGTRKDNADDREAHGRTARGLRCRNQNRDKTHCLHGHAFDEANTGMDGRSRRCRACAREYWRTRGTACRRARLDAAGRAS